MHYACYMFPLPRVLLRCCLVLICLLSANSVIGRTLPPLLWIALLCGASLPGLARSGPMPLHAALPARAGRRPPIVVEPRRPRDIVVLDGAIGAPVAILPNGNALFITDQNILGQIGPEGYIRWTLLLGAVQGAPALDESGTSYVASRDGTLYSVSADGRQRWERALLGRPCGGVAVGPTELVVGLNTGVVRWWRRSDGASLGSVAIGVSPSAAPVLALAGRAIVPTVDGQLVGVSPSAVLWRTRQAGGAAAGPIALGPQGEVYAGTQDGWLDAIDADGALRWQVQVGAPIARSPVLAEGGAVYVAAADEVLAVSRAGLIRWRRAVGGRVAGGPLVADDGTVFAVVETASHQGAAIGLAPDGQITSRQALAAPPMSSLSLAEHHLWVGLRNGTVQRLLVPQQGLARSTWAKARGDLSNTGTAR